MMDGRDPASDFMSGSVNSLQTSGYSTLPLLVNSLVEVCPESLFLTFLPLEGLGLGFGGWLSNVLTASIMIETLGSNILCFLAEV